MKNRTNPAKQLLEMKEQGRQLEEIILEYSLLQ